MATSLAIIMLLGLLSNHLLKKLKLPGLLGMSKFKKNSLNSYPFKGRTGDKERRYKKGR